MTFHCLHAPCCVYPSIDGHVAYFYLLTIVGNASMNINRQASVGVPAFRSFVYIPRVELLAHHGTFFCVKLKRFPEEKSFKA